MRLFVCQACGNGLFFEDTRCGHCGRATGFLPAFAELSALEPDGDGFLALAEGKHCYRACRNAADGVCNWLVDDGSPEVYCAACRHNRTVPVLSNPVGRERWRKLEIAKHRLVYSLIRLGIPLPNRIDDPQSGLAFDFLEELPGRRVITGHLGGVITVAAEEADDAFREAMRHRMHETYRTLLGHLRHEIGHWIWNRLVRDGGRLDECRALFGDERADYAAALERHYRDGPAADWPERTITAYAGAHPWEDFAETWAHYLHVIDTLEMAASFRLALHPDALPALEPPPDPFGEPVIGPLIERWLSLVTAINSLNRSMGLADPYPFVLTPRVIEKLAFMHRLVRDD